MGKKDELSKAIEKTKLLIDAPPCRPELKEAAQKWLDSIETPGECDAAFAFVNALKENIRPIDSLIEFATSGDAKNHLGEKDAKLLAEHALEIKIAGGKYCDCTACAAACEILEMQDLILGEELSKKQCVVEALQIIVTELAQQADGHIIQSKIFAAQGLNKLAKSYEDHAAEERGYVSKCIDRLLDLGCPVKLGCKKSGPVFDNAIEYLKHDLQVSKDGLAWLAEVVKAAQNDWASFDILKKYYLDEEKDMHETEQKLELIERIGEKNWYATQI